MCVGLARAASHNELTALESQTTSSNARARTAPIILPSALVIYDGGYLRAISSSVAALQSCPTFAQNVDSVKLVALDQCSRSIQCVSRYRHSHLRTGLKQMNGRFQKGRAAIPVVAQKRLTASRSLRASTRLMPPDACRDRREGRARRSRICSHCSARSRLWQATAVQHWRHRQLPEGHRHD